MFQTAHILQTHIIPSSAQAYTYEDKQFNQLHLSVHSAL